MLQLIGFSFRPTAALLHEMTQRYGAFRALRRPERTKGVELAAQFGVDLAAVQQSCRDRAPPADQAAAPSSGERHARRVPRAQRHQMGDTQAPFRRRELAIAVNAASEAIGVRCADVVTTELRFRTTRMTTRAERPAGATTASDTGEAWGKRREDMNVLRHAILICQ